MAEEPAIDLPPVDEWVKRLEVRSTAEVKVPEKLVEQVIGQEGAVEIIKKAAEQKRHVMLIGDPGTGKSMLARSIAELLPRDELQDIIVYHNPEDTNEPKIRVVPAGKGREIVNQQKAEAMQRREQKASMVMILLIFFIGLIVLLSITWTNPPTINPMVLLLGIFVAGILYMARRYTGHRPETLMVPKLLVGHSPDDMPAFIDATGSHAGALLGDVKHDPFQNEINILRMESQQSLLTAMQEKKFSIVGQSERSSGAMVKTEAVPCDFLLVAAGNLDAVAGMHPALRSRIRGYGYEIYMKSTMPDTQENRMKLVRFVAQEVSKDKKIPHFDRMAVAEILREAQRRAGRRGQLTLRLRELGGLIRVAGDMAVEQSAPLVLAEHVVGAKKIARSLEQQVADRLIERGKEYKTFVTEGAVVGVVNGLAVLVADNSMAEFSGLVLPIAAEVTPAQTKHGGKIIATGRLGEIAKEAVENVSALVKKYTGEDISNHDIHVQFVGSREGTEGDSASISVATAVISAIEEVEVDQSVAMTGSLSVRGQVLPVGGVTAKIEAAAEMGIRKVIIPKSNMKDVLLEDRYMGRIEIVPAETLKDVLEHALVGPKKERLLTKLAALVPKPSILERPPVPRAVVPQ